MMRQRLERARSFARRLRQARGVSAVEFALLAPVFMGCVFLLIEGGRMAWTQQVLNEVAANAARCMSVGDAPCADVASIQTYARARGSSWGIGLASATITVSGNQTCQSVTGMNRIAISLPYATAVGSILPAAPTSLSSVACYPSIT